MANNNGDEDNKKDNENPDKAPTPKKPKPEYIPDGISHAYEDIPVYEGQPKEKKEKKKSSRNPIQPPERKRGGSKSSGGKDIMEVFWNEFIMAFYETAIDFVVDNTLDFVEWWLFKANLPDDDKPEKEKREKKDIYTLGQEILQERMVKPTKNNDLFNKAFNEIAENLDRENAGAAAVWTIWKKAPTFFAELKQIAAEASQAPDSEEAKFMERFRKTPELILGLFKKEYKLQQVAIAIATLEEMTDEKKATMPNDFSTGMANIEALLKNKKIDTTSLKNEINSQTDNLIAILKADNASFKSIKTKLTEIKTIASGDITNNKTAKKNIETKFKEIKDVIKSDECTEDCRKERISERSHIYYEQISENIDKIEEAYINNPAEMKNISKNYMMHIATQIKTTKTSVDAANSRFSRSTTRNNAKKEVLSLMDTIGNFKIGSKEIKTIKKAKEKRNYPLKDSNELKVFDAIKRYGYRGA